MTYEAVQVISGRWEIRSHHDDCAEGIPLNEAETKRAVAILRAAEGLPAAADLVDALAVTYKAADRGGWRTRADVERVEGILIKLGRL